MKIKFDHRHRIIKIPGAFTLVFMAFGLLATPALAISQGYRTNDNAIVPGMTLSLGGTSEEGGQLVERASKDNLPNIVGVATTVDDSLLTVASSDQTIFVENKGDVKAYVSDLNGVPKKGDILSISPLKGVLEVAQKESMITIGTVVENFPESGYKQEQIKKGQSTIDTKVAKITINLNIRYPSNDADVDSTLSRFGKSIIGKNVSAARVAISIAIFLLILFIIGSILYSAISSAIISVGRNPLAGKVVRKQLVRVFVMVLTIFALGLATMYLVLWL